MPVDDDLLERLRETADRSEIHQALMRYCRGVDRGDEALINSVFHPGAVVDQGQPMLAAELARRVAQGQVQLMHFIGNVLIELEGENAHVETYFISFSPQQDEDGTTFTRTRAGRYLDRFERRDGTWKIAQRMLVDDWARLDEVKRTPARVGIRRGLRSQDDPVFHLKELLSSSGGL